MSLISPLVVTEPFKQRGDELLFAQPWPSAFAKADRGVILTLYEVDELCRRLDPDVDVGRRRRSTASCGKSHVLAKD
jgi:hypothetical protein